jgi:hypothetical protein
MYLEQLMKKLDRSPVVPTHLDDVNWRVHLRLGNDTMHKILEPSALFQFELTDPNGENVCWKFLPHLTVSRSLILFWNSIMTSYMISSTK